MERNHAERIISLGSQGRRIEKGTALHPNWLLSSIDAREWVIATPTTILEKGVWRGSRRVSWSVHLEGGGLLTDAIHRDYLNFLKQSAILLRSGALRRVSTQSFMQWICDAKLITSWVYRNCGYFDPDKRHLSYFDGDALDDMLRGLSSGKVLAASNDLVICCLERMLNIMEVPQNISSIVDPHCLPLLLRNMIVSWLRREVGFHIYRGQVRIKRDVFLKVIGIDDVSGRQALARFLSQFELDKNGNRYSSNLSREYPEFSAKRSRLLAPGGPTLHRILRHWEVWQGLHIHFPHALPVVKGNEYTKAHNTVHRLRVPSGHTEWLPIPIVLVYLREAIKYVSTYGELLVDYYIAVLEAFAQHNAFGVSGNPAAVRVGKCEMRREIAERLRPKGLEVLRVSGWAHGTYGANRFERLRSAPSLVEAISMLVAAAAILIATIKPIRLDELRLLKRNCLFVGHDGGFWLEHTRLKRVVQDRREHIRRPIPNIAAHAIQLLIRLGDRCAPYVPARTSVDSNNLFHLPTMNREGIIYCTQLSHDALYKYFDRFGDFIAPANVTQERRWYVRIHQLRKSFLITYFWCFKYASLDAARWIAGHSDASHIYAYIEANFPGDELPRIEASYARDQLLSFERKNGDQEVDRIEDLHRAVCRHFRVSSVSAIAEVELLMWLRHAFSSGIYKIEIFNLKNGNASEISIAVRVIEEGGNAS